MVHTDSMSIEMDKTDGDLFDFSPATEGFDFKGKGHLHIMAFRIMMAIASLLLMVHAVRADTPPANFFPIGVYWQPTSSYDLWQSRGINTTIFFSDRQDWLMEAQNAALAHNFWMIRNPQQNIAADINQKHLLAFSHPDEPDINSISPASIAQNYAQWKAAAPNIPVILNVSGQNAQYQLDSLTDKIYKDYTKSTDWVSNDVYPITAWGRPDWIDKAVKLDPTQPINNNGVAFNPGNSVDKLRDLSGGKKQMAYIETSYQQLDSRSNRAATPDEVRGQTWDAILHGAKGILYFPQQFSPDKSDATSPEVSAEITKTDALITKMGGVINAIPDSQSNYMNLTGGLEGTWRKIGNKTYYFVLNFSHTSVHDAAIQLLAGKTGEKAQVLDESRNALLAGTTINDSFDPYQLHIYELDDSSGSGTNSGSSGTGSGSTGTGSTGTGGTTGGTSGTGTTNTPSSGRPKHKKVKSVNPLPTRGANTGLTVHSKQVLVGSTPVQHLLPHGAYTGLTAHRDSLFADASTEVTGSLVNVVPVPEPTSGLFAFAVVALTLRRPRNKASK